MFATIAAASVILAAPQRKMSTAADEAAIRNQYRKWERVIETKNFRSARSLVTSDFVQVSPEGHKASARTMEREYTGMFKSLSKIDCEIEVMDVKVSGRTATAEIRFEIDAKSKDKSGQHHTRVQGSEVNRWRKVRGRWLQAYGKTHDVSTMVDGRLVSHSP